MQRPEIKALLLDLGGVVFELDWDRPLRSLGLEPFSASEQLQHWNEQGDFDLLERGKISLTEFQTSFLDGMFAEIDPNEFNNAWNSLIVGPFPEIDFLLDQYRSKVPLYGLSNISLSHWEYIQDTYPFMNRFLRVFTSFEFGHRKPEREIYESVLKELALPAENVLFVDDNLMNVEQARALGLQAELLSHSPKHLKTILQSYLYA